MDHNNQKRPRKKNELLEKNPKTGFEGKNLGKQDKNRKTGQHPRKQEKQSLQELWDQFSEIRK